MSWSLFLQLVYMLLYYPTLQHAFMTKFVLRKYSSLLFLLKVFAFPLFSKLLKNQDTPLSIAQSSFCLSPDIFFEKYFEKFFISWWVFGFFLRINQEYVGLSSKRFLWYQLEKTWIFCFVCQACMAKLTITYFMDIVSLERKCHLAFRIQYTWYFYKAKDYSFHTVLPGIS